MLQQLKCKKYIPMLNKNKSNFKNVIIKYGFYE